MAPLQMLTTKNSTFGIAYQYIPDPDVFLDFQLGTVTDAFRDWASRDGGTLNVIERANDFVDLVSIGATFPPDSPGRRVKPRSRSEQCPAEGKDLLQYGTDERPVEQDLRFNPQLQAVAQ
ncbi:MAG: hypothetical protein Q9176_003810 [Flavoplaca citrina]